MPSKTLCPICENHPTIEAYAPFCSKRCADVDLSRWMKGGYAIPGASLEDTEEAPPGPVSDD